jgi:Short C-terminal domain
VAPGGQASDQGDERIRRLKDLAELRDAGVLTDEEFAAEKARVLGSHSVAVRSGSRWSSRVLSCSWPRSCSSATPFGKSVSERVSETWGSPAHCKLAGLAEIAGAQTKVYNCAARFGAATSISVAR